MANRRGSVGLGDYARLGGDAGLVSIPLDYVAALARAELAAEKLQHIFAVHFPN